VRVRLHDGVVLAGRTAHDSARRSVLELPEERGAARDAALLRERYARLELGAPEVVALVRATASRRSRAPLALLRHGFRRRRALAPAPGVLAHALLAALLPGMAVALLMLVAGVGIGSFAGAAGTGAAAAASGALVWWLSIAVHETGHLVALRAVTSDRSLGAIEHSWVNVWIVGPRLPHRQAAWVALAGPVAGAAACFCLLVAGVPDWICWLAAVAHLANLGPFAADGRQLLGESPPGRGEYATETGRRGSEPSSLA
jgi:hypothetical protein